MKVRGWPEIGPDSGVLLTPYISYGIAGTDDDVGSTIISVLEVVAFVVIQDTLCHV